MASSLISSSSSPHFFSIHCKTHLLFHLRGTAHFTDSYKVLTFTAPTCSFRPRLAPTLSSPRDEALSCPRDDERGVDFPPLPSFKERPARFALWVLFWAAASLAWFAASGDANAKAVDSIRASGFGLKVASKLRTSGWHDEWIVFALATLPVIELRGAIPVGYWMQLRPDVLTVLSVLGLDCLNFDGVYFVIRIE